MVIVDFFLGIGSRYSYLAASQVERIEATYGCRFIWKPIASGALMDRRGDNPFRGEPVSGQYDWGYREYDAKCWAAYYGIPFREPVKFRVDPVSLALACLAADRQGALVACCRLLQRLIFIDGRVIDDGPARPRGAARPRRADVRTGPDGAGDRRAARRLARRSAFARRLRGADLLPRCPDVLGQRPARAAGSGTYRRCDTASGARPHHVGVFDGDFSGDRFYSLPDVVGRSALNTKI